MCYIYHLFFIIHFVISQCSLSCEGGVKTRTVKCVAKRPGLCDPANRPRSTILCNLQSCSSNHKWTGSSFIPRFRPRVPPKLSTTPPNPTTITDYMTQTSAPTATSDFIHEEDQDFIWVKKTEDDGGHGGVGTKISEEEEGSTNLQTPDKSYTPGYDYIVGEEEREDNIIPTRTPSSVQTPARTHLYTTTVTSPEHANVHTTTQATKTHQTAATPALSFSKWELKPTSSYNLKTNSTTRKTLKILRQTSNATRDLNRDLKVPKQRLETIIRSGHYGNLNAPDPVGRNAFWEVGNWSDVRMQMSFL